MADTQYNVSNKTVEARLFRKQYTMSNLTVVGYEDATFNPANFTPNDNVFAKEVAVTAGGTLTLSVTDDADPANKIDLTNATITRVSNDTDDATTTTYTSLAPDCFTKGSDENINQVTVKHLPYSADADATVNVYIKIVLADYGTQIFTIQMNQKATSTTVTFPAMSDVDLTFADANWENAFPDTEGQITLTD